VTSSRLVLLASMVLAAGSGCGGAAAPVRLEAGRPVPLALFVVDTGYFFVEWRDEGDVVKVYAGPEGLWLPDAPHCGTFPSGVVATLNGHPMMVPAKVGVLSVSGSPEECLSPTLSVPIDGTWLDGSDGQLIVADAETTWSIAVPSLMTGRHPVAQFPEGATVGAGDQLDFDWSGSMPAAFNIESAYFDTGDRLYDAHVASSSGTTSVIVPSGTPAGAAQLHLELEFDFAGATCPLPSCFARGIIKRTNKVSLR